MDSIGAIIFFLAPLLFGFMTGRHIGLGEAAHWKDRVRELERREGRLMRTILELKRTGHELPPEPEPLEPPYVIDDEYAVQVAEERARHAAEQEDIINMVLDED